MQKIKIETVYILFAILFIALAFIVGSSAIRIFTALRVSNEVDAKLLESSTPRLTLDKLEEAHRKLIDERMVLLDELR